MLSTQKKDEFEKKMIDRWLATQALYERQQRGEKTDQRPVVFYDSKHNSNKSDQGVQTDPAPAQDADHNTILDDLVIILHEISESTPDSIKSIFNRLNKTFDVFQCVRKNDFSRANKKIFQLCYQISAACVTHAINKLDSSSNEQKIYSLFRRSLCMQEYYRDHYDPLGVERELIEALVKTTGEYEKFMHAKSDNAFVLLDFTDEADSQKVDGMLHCATQTEMDCLELKHEGRIFPFASVNTTQLRDQFNQLKHKLQKTHLSNKMHKQLCELRRNINDYIQPLQKNQNLEALPNILKELELALEIETIYIHHLKTQDKSAYKLANAIQKAAHLFRIYNTYYQRSNATQEAKLQLTKSMRLIQEYTLNAKQVLVCSQVIAAKKTSNSEKDRAQAKHDELQKEIRSKSTNIFSTYLDLIAPHKDELRINEMQHLSMLEQYELLKQGLMLTAMDSFQIDSLYSTASAYLDNVLNSLLPQASYCPSYVLFVDSPIQKEDDFQDIDQDNLLELLQDSQPKSVLFQAIDIYYDIKIKNFQTALQSIDAAHEEYREFVDAQRFMSEFRKEVYKYFLLDTENTDLCLVKNNCEQFINAGNDSTPFIYLLAKQRLSIANQQEQNFIHENKTKIPHSDTLKLEKTSDEIKPMDQSSVKQKLAVPDNIKCLLFERKFTNLSSPGWIICKNEVNTCFRSKKFTEALSLLDEWIKDTTSQSNFSTFLQNKSLFDALIHKAIIYRKLERYQEAIDSVNKANDYLAPSSYTKVLNYQTQIILCEQGEIYLARSQFPLTKEHPNYLRESATDCFVRAEAKAADIDEICFKAVWSKDLKNGFKIENNSLVEKLIAYLFDPERSLEIDEYNLSYFYRTYEKIAHEFTILGILELKQSAANKLFSSEHSLSQENEHNLMAIKIYQSLLNYSCNYFHTGLFEIYLKLAKLYHILYSFQPREKYRIEATNFYNEALKKASGPNCHDVVTEIKGFIKRLKDTPIQVNQSVLSFRYTENKNKQREEYDRGRINAAELVSQTFSEEQRVADFKSAINQHTLLSQVKNILLLLNIKQRLDLQKFAEQYIELEQKLYVGSLNPSSIFSGQCAALGLIYKAAYATALKDGAPSIDVLLKWRDIEQSYLAKILNMQREAELKVELRITSSLSTESNWLIDKQQKKVSVIDSLIKKQNSTIELLEPALQPLRNLDRNASLFNCLNTEGRSVEFKEAVSCLEQNKPWQALIFLFCCLDNKINKDYRKKEVFVMIVHILLWLIESLHLTEVVELIDTPELQRLYQHIYKQVINCCKTYLNNARDIPHPQSLSKTNRELFFRDTNIEDELNGYSERLKTLKSMKPSFVEHKAEESMTQGVAQEHSGYTP